MESAKFSVWENDADDVFGADKYEPRKQYKQDLSYYSAFRGSPGHEENSPLPFNNIRGIYTRLNIDVMNQYANRLLGDVVHNAFSGNIKVIEPLISEGFIEVKNNCGNTLLHYFTSLGDIQMMKLLICNGADIEATNMDGNTPLHLAASEGFIKGVDLLLSSFSAELQCDGTFLYNDVLDAYIKPMKRFANSKDNCENTPLHLAALNGNTGVIDLLMCNGADINAVNINKNTPLDIAVLKGKILFKLTSMMYIYLLCV